RTKCSATRHAEESRQWINRHRGAAGHGRAARRARVNRIDRVAARHSLIAKAQRAACPGYRRTHIDRTALELVIDSNVRTAQSHRRSCAARTKCSVTRHAEES